MARLQLGSRVSLCEMFSKRNPATQSGSFPYATSIGLRFAPESESSGMRAYSWGAHVMKVLTRSGDVSRSVRLPRARASSSSPEEVQLDGAREADTLVTSQTWTRLQMRVVRRDRHRCRGCDKNGDEVTLGVCPISRDLLAAGEMVTLCTRCHDLVIDAELSADSIPDFLRRLWYYLHPAHEAGLPASRNEGTPTGSACEPA